MSEDPAAIPAEMIEKLTQVATRIADRSVGERPTEAATVATTIGKAVKLLHNAGVLGSGHHPVYVITMRGRFLPRGHGPGSGKIPTGSVRTVVVHADTLKGGLTRTGDQDYRELLPPLGPVTILHIPPKPVTHLRGAE